MSRNEPLTVACVLKTGGDYDVEYVHRLHEGVSAHLKSPHRFVCLSNAETGLDRIPLSYDWPGWWSKMELFRPGIIGGDVLYFDLDTIIVGDLSAIAVQRRTTAISDFNRPGRFASGMMYLTEKIRRIVWDEWSTDPYGNMEKFRSGGDQDFLHNVFFKDTVFPGVSWWQDSLPGQVVSYKVHRVAEGIPANARVICFHGRPRPRDIGWKI